MSPTQSSSRDLETLRIQQLIMGIVLSNQHCIIGKTLLPYSGKVMILGATPLHQNLSLKGSCVASMQ